MPGSGRAPGERNGYPLQFSCLENSMGRRAWWATLHGVLKSWTRLTNTHTHTHTHTHTEIISLFHLLNTQAKSDSLPVFSLELLCGLRRVKHEVGGHNTAPSIPEGHRLLPCVFEKGHVTWPKKCGQKCEGHCKPKLEKLFLKTSRE